ncbi:TetR/AcrR family transcriptional regulator [Gryllotalpicola protaetiae]|uniref:TetR/AcrR family transcriptional regulator n=1 Tax=Gryllotalpicola protaetiae TaxID=2419771 RepID=A0A387BH81_9MICO|nr:TetR/AcrR family transcriptional regulator [Gryllotalpicola protaetiae]AYG03375.1 TetR/AcrR family transcriptional regulator [Gryllotalpicola protaetiae]
MSLKEDSQTPQRRRGEALENALLDAAWDELDEKGYDGFTIESVAERAKTSRAVVYRRWASKPELVTATVARWAQQGRAIVPDTGTLRGDLLEIFRRANETRAPYAVLMSARLGAYYAETGTSFADLRETFLSGRTSTLDTVLNRAAARGEIDAAKLTPRIRAVAFDLYRHELLMTLKPVPEDVIESIIDEVVLPLMKKG